MAKQNAVPIDSDGDVSMCKRKSTHTVNLTVTLDPGKPDDRTVRISNEILRICNGDTVIWAWRFVDSKQNPVIAKGAQEIRFGASGKVDTKKLQGAVGGRQIASVLQGSFGDEPHWEPYSVIFEGRQLRFVSSSNPPLSEPSLVIPPVSDPPGGPGTSGQHRPSQRDDERPDTDR